jgi:hypothetical protein
MGSGSTAQPTNFWRCRRAPEVSRRASEVSRCAPEVSRRAPEVSLRAERVRAALPRGLVRP